MPWQPLPRIAFAVATFPFSASSPADLPLELGDELYIIEQNGIGDNADWYRGYLVAPPSLLAGLTSSKGQTLEARVFSGVFPSSCVEVKEVLGEDEEDEENEVGSETPPEPGSGGVKSPLSNGQVKPRSAKHGGVNGISQGGTGGGKEKRRPHEWEPINGNETRSEYTQTRSACSNAEDWG